MYEKGEVQTVGYRAWVIAPKTWLDGHSALSLWNHSILTSYWIAYLDSKIYDGAPYATNKIYIQTLMIHPVRFNKVTIKLDDNNKLYKLATICLCTWHLLWFCLAVAPHSGGRAGDRQ